MSSPPSPSTSDCNCADTAGQLADKICVKIGGIAGQETQSVCVSVTDELKSGKVTVSEWVKKVGEQLKAKNVSPDVLEKAFVQAISEVKRQPSSSQESVQAGVGGQGEGTPELPSPSSSSENPGQGAEP